MRFISTICIAWLLHVSACQGQQTVKTMSNTANALLCDPNESICAIPGQTSGTKTGALPKNHTKKPVRILYFTDPICSACWGIEPQLRRLKLEYGHAVEIEYRMGGLLPQWEGFNGGGITKPSDVAGHWDEVSHHYEMPIDGDVWLEDPLPSSFPPSIAFKAAQMQDEQMALRFLRRIREMVFLEKKNIARWEHLEAAARQVGLDAAQLKTDFEGRAKQAFQEDLNLARQLGVRGFPTLIFNDTTGQKLLLHGARPYAFFERNVQTLAPDVPKTPFDNSPVALFAQFPTLTLKEFSMLSGLSNTEAEATLEALVAARNLTKINTKNGALWRVRGE